MNPGLGSGVLGHKRQLESIDRALSSGKVPHAYLFSGIGGIGKRLVAMKLAQALQCLSGKDRPCGVCKGCVKAGEGSHPDVIIIEPEGNFIKIEQVRELQKRLSYRPFEGKATVCIIEGADKFNLSSGNALLKTLEEPPSGAYLILLAENTRHVIRTIISRCQRLKFSLLSSDDISEILLKEKGISRDDALSVAFVAEGSPGKAIKFLDNFPLEDKEKFLNALVSFNGIDEVFSLAEELTGKENVERLTHMLEILKLFLRDIVLLKLGIGDDRLANIFNKKAAEKESQMYSLVALFDMAEMVSGTEAAILMNVNKRLAIENLLLNYYNKRAGKC